MPLKIVFSFMLGFNDTSTLEGYLCHLPEKGRRVIEEIVEEMKERDRGEKQMNESEETEEIKTSPSTRTCSKDRRPCPTVSQYQLNALVT